MKMSILLAQHNVTLVLADHLSPILRDIFDGELARCYTCARTKISAILNHSIAPAFKAELVTAMQSSQYSLLIDGSNDSGLEKINTITVKIFDAICGRVCCRFLDMCIYHN